MSYLVPGSNHAAVLVMTNHPPCVICGGEVVRRVPSEGRERWMARPTCGETCGVKYRNRDSRERMQQIMRDRAPCRCGRRILPHDRESVSRYLSRNYCSPECARGAMWATRLRREPSNGVGASVPAQSIEDYLAAGGKITRMPPAYVAPSIQAQLPLEEERRRIKSIRPPTTPTYKGGNRWLFVKPALSAGKP